MKRKLKHLILFSLSVAIFLGFLFTRPTVPPYYWLVDDTIFVPPEKPDSILLDTGICLCIILVIFGILELIVLVVTKISKRPLKHKYL